MSHVTLYEGTPAAGVNVAVDKYYPFVFLGHATGGAGAVVVLTFGRGRVQDLIDGNGNVVEVKRPGNVLVTSAGNITLMASDCRDEAYQLGR